MGELGPREQTKTSTRNTKLSFGWIQMWREVTEDKEEGVQEEEKGGEEAAGTRGEEEGRGLLDAKEAHVSSQPRHIPST